MKFVFRFVLALPVALVLTSAPRAEEGKKEAAKKETVAVKVVKDLAYAGGQAHERQKIDLYLPEGKKDFPTILFVHGGGFTKGERTDVADLGNLLAKRGVAVAAVGYRLHPDVKHPSQIQDVAKAFAWIKNNIKAHGGRSDALFVAGFSTGAHLASLLGTDERYLKAEKLALSDVRGVLALSGPYRLPKARVDVFGSEEGVKDASPIEHVKAGLPAFLLVYGDQEKAGREKQTSAFADAIKENKGQVEVVIAKDRDHPGLFKGVSEGDTVTDAVVAFIVKLSSNKTGN